MRADSPADDAGAKRRKRGADAIGNIVDRWLKTNRVRQRVDAQSLFGKWRAIVGERIARRTRVVDLRGGELLIEVSSAALLGELSTYYSQDILESLQAEEEFRGVTSLRFRSGSL